MNRLVRICLIIELSIFKWGIYFLKIPKGTIYKEIIMQTNYLTYTEPGKRNVNQDELKAYTHDNYTVKNKDMGELFIVTDGMGGEQAGKAAANLVCEKIFDTYYASPKGPDFDNHDIITQFMEQAMMAINMQIKHEGDTNPQKKGWGCAASILMIRPPSYYFVHTGDTRIYHIQNGDARLLTEDHNIAYQKYLMQRLSYEKYLTSSGHNKLLSFCGMGEGISIQTGADQLQSGDRFILCSDGLNQFMQIQDVASFVKDHAHLTDIALFSEITATVDPDAADDNVSIMLVGYHPKESDHV